MGTLRSIRLKEFDPNTEAWHEPTAEYRGRCNETLEPGPFQQVADENGFLATGNAQLEGNPVVFLGDSFVESLFADPLVRFVSQVERLTGQRCWNGGYSGATTLHLLNTLVNKVYPAVGVGGRIVFFAGQSEADYLASPSSYWTNHRRGTSLVPGKLPVAVDLPKPSDATARLLQVVVDSARTLGIQLTLAVSAFALPDFASDQAIQNIYRGDRARYENMLARREAIALAARRVAATNEVPLIDAHAFLGGDPELFYDELHLNRNGHAKLAKYISEKIATP